MSWTGWDGSVWPLTSPETGLFLQTGIRGLHLPSFTRQSTTSPFVPGSRHRGTVTNDRDVFWPAFVYSDSSSDEFLARDKAFWASFDTDLEGTWTAALPDGSSRTLGLKLISADDAMDYDPIKRGWGSYGITLIADQPYWSGATVRRSWAQGDLRDFYVTPTDTTTYGYASDVILYLSSGGSLGSATFTNDGDVPTYPVWTVIGPTTAVSFGVEGSTITVPFTIADGYAVQIDTDPINGQVLWYGPWDGKQITAPVDRTSELDPASKFVAIPRGQDKVLSITMTGTGAVIAEVTNKYKRAW